MNTFFKRLSLTGFAVALSSAGFAADLPAPVIEHIPEVPAVGGFYLRGDIGYKIYGDPTGSFQEPGATDLRFDGESMDNAWMIGVGVGYQFNQYLRADITLDYETPAEAFGYADCGTCTNLQSEEFADIDVWTTMVNAYIDIGTWNRITPYVGAGIGAAYVRTDNAASINPGQADGVYRGTNGEWNFAWALMAGAEYAVNNNFSIDAGYRYKDLGDAKTVLYDNVRTGQGRVHWEDLTAHEFRLGARYTFNSGFASPAPVIYQPQGPISSNF
ncbi:outer membrane protein [uncultured Roseibium sp.]|uniref:outer membrane protein n=1 Tax=uncultured Roseibium sp. TaxID=1936171 RepID=UPI00261AD3F5|nr:outer membrane protein [uncultured Roseibium sp.]